MARNEQQPVASDNGRDGTRYTHPAFGQITAGRVSGGGVSLYGSDFAHNNFVTISIHGSVLDRQLSRDWHFPRDEVVEVYLSEAQWATFVSSMNVGGGVPCTLARVQGETMPAIPFRSQHEDFKAELNGTVEGMTARIDATIQQMRDGIGASLSNKKRDELLAELVRLRQDVSSSLPYVAQSFGEHMEQTVEKAKIEVNAYVHSAVTRAGLTALSEGGAAPLQLSAPSDTQEAPR